MRTASQLEHQYRVAVDSLDEQKEFTAKDKVDALNCVEASLKTITLINIAHSLERIADRLGSASPMEKDT